MLLDFVLLICSVERLRLRVAVAGLSDWRCIPFNVVLSAGKEGIPFNTNSVRAVEFLITLSWFGHAFYNKLLRTPRFTEGLKSAADIFG